MSNKLKKIEISSFRAFNKKQIFDFTCNGKIANLVVIFGPNGFGKTSFLDAVEWGLTGKINRIDDNKIIRDKANSEKGYILKNTNSKSENGEVVFVSDNDDKMIRTTQPLDGRCKRDYKVGNKEFKGETFKNIYKENVNNNNILAHDQIDSFLKSVTPEERYNGLVSFWDYTNDAEEYQKILEVYKIGQDHIKENKKELNQKKKELRGIKSEIYSIEKLNEDLSKLNEILNGDEITLLSDDFNKDDLNNIKEILLSNITIIEQYVNKQNDENEKIKYLYNNYDEYKSNCDKYIEKNKIIKSLKQKLDLYKEYKNKIIEKSIKDKKIKELKYQNKNIKFLLENIDEYESEINNIKKLKEDIRNIEKNLNVIDSIHFEINNKIQSDNNKRDNLIKKINLYNKKVSSSKKFIEYNEKLKVIKNTKNNLYKELEKLNYNVLNIESNNREKEKNIEYIYKINSINDLNFIPDIYENYSNDLKNSFEFYDFIKKEISNNNKNFERVLDLKNDAKELVIAGLKYIENTNTNICPLCNKEFDNYKNLIKEINTKISNVEIADKLKYDNEELNKKEKEISLIINNKKEIIIELIKLDIKNNNDDIYDIKLKIKELERKIINLENQIKLIIGEIDLISIVFEEDEIALLNEKNKTHIIESRWERIIGENENYFKEIDKIIKENEKEREKFLGIINDLKKGIKYKLNRIKEIESKELIETFIIRLKENNINNKKEIIELSKEINDKINVTTKEENKINEEIILLIENIKDSDEKTISNQLEIENNSVEKLIKKIHIYESFIKYIKDEFKNINKDTLIVIIKNKEIKIEENKKTIQLLKITLDKVLLLNNNIKFNKVNNEVKQKENYIKYLNEMNKIIEKVKIESTEYIENKINRAFDTKMINAIYDMIEPHPELKEIKIIPNFECAKPQLNIYSLNKEGNRHEPALYLSSAQLNILSLSIFLARTLNDKTNNMNTIFMDDTIEHLDSINTLSFIDLIRNIISVLDIQIIITTHNEDLFNLLKRKVDPKYYNAKYLELYGFGMLKGDSKNNCVDFHKD